MLLAGQDVLDPHDIDLKMICFRVLRARAQQHRFHVGQSIFVSVEHLEGQHCGYGFYGRVRKVVEWLMRTHWPTAQYELWVEVHVLSGFHIDWQNARPWATFPLWRPCNRSPSVEMAGICSPLR
jgi:hypothetical protein